MKKLKTVALATLLLSATLFAQNIPQNIIDTGNNASKELLKKLGSNLKHELKTNGLIAAANFCTDSAFTLTQEVNLHQLEGVSVKRISLKESNPLNKASADEIKVLESMQKLLDEKKLPDYIVEQDDKGYKYYKPLVITKEVCLKCHGDISKNKELTEFMNKTYPEDKAFGYKMNDLRGAIVVEVKK